MNDSYRWWYAMLLSASVLLIAYFLVIQPEQGEVLRLQLEKQQLVERLNNLKQFAQEKNGEMSSVAMAKAFVTHRIDKIGLLSLLPALANQYAVSIQSMQFYTPTMQLPDDITMHLVVEGRVEPLSRFALALMSNENGIAILNFSYRLLGQLKLQLEADVQVIPNHVGLLQMSSKQEAFLFVRNPFCQADNHMPPITRDDRALLMAIPLTQIRMTGLIQQAARKLALLTLPTGVVVDVAVGDVVGKEKGVITDISADRVEVLVGKERIYIVG